MAKAKSNKKQTTEPISYMTLLLLVIAAVFLFIIFGHNFNLRTKTVDPRLWMGIESIELTADIKKQYGISFLNGILVSRTFNGSPAEIAGIKIGDVIRRWNGISITNQDQFQYLIQTSAENERITLTIDREGKIELVNVEVGVRPGINL
ncbi:MAG: PDZ domain-containing protein [Candidatus Omnitrophica bacterium]|nr:PDZ domain-containing protein [Candidatus Omnitrophota bacterium]